MNVVFSVMLGFSYSGDLTLLRKAESAILDEMENDIAQEAESEEREPANKKKRLDKENTRTSSLSRRTKKKRNPLKEIQVCLHTVI